MNAHPKHKIRVAHQDDAQKIATLGSLTFKETFGHLFRDKKDIRNYCETTFSVKKIESSLRKDNNAFWIAFVENLPVGYAKLKKHSPCPFIVSEQLCQLQKIYVLRDYLSLKIGFELQHQLLKKATQLGFQNIWLSVLDSNERALKFYHKNGFRTIGNHDFQIGQEHFEFAVLALQLYGKK